MIEPGSEITWIVTKKHRKGLSFTAREGKMVRFGEHISLCKMRNGKECLVKTGLIRKASEKNALTEAFALGSA